jgi:hypothetical protein
MSPVRREGGKPLVIENWGSHVDHMIREAQARGEFDNLPGAGKPLDLGDDSPFGAEWAMAHRIAKNAGAAPLWVELGREIAHKTEALALQLQRTSAYVAGQEARLRARDKPVEVPEPAVKGVPPPSRGQRRWWSLIRRERHRPAAAPARAAADGHPTSLDDLEAERRRARSRYLAGAAEVDKKIVEFNLHRPRELPWLEKPRLLPAQAAAEFDTACPAVR